MQQALLGASLRSRVWRRAGWSDARSSPGKTLGIDCKRQDVELIGQRLASKQMIGVFGNINRRDDMANGTEPDRDPIGDAEESIDRPRCAMGELRPLGVGPGVIRPLGGQMIRIALVGFSFAVLLRGVPPMFSFIAFAWRTIPNYDLARVILPGMFTERTLGDDRHWQPVPDAINLPAQTAPRSVGTSRHGSMTLGWSWLSELDRVEQKLETAGFSLRAAIFVAATLS